ncbi:glutaredoxin family protein [Brucella intermedia]|uniref:Glutaredoxin n=1 Tax=Brucella intermedia M86 TaxID=1234597 RepID=M5JSV3_9HYPH|nr:glutaredoxin family protein [Brucella intermedia]ELT51232.1 glutaredoxin [Brucella intermedia M86]
MEAPNPVPVIVYTTPTCPDCRTLKRWLQDNGIEFEERDLTDLDVIAEAKERTGVRVAPITIVGEEFFFGTFERQLPDLRRVFADVLAK